MQRDPRNGFDRKGLAFVAKTLIVIALLVVSTKLLANGASVFFLSVPGNTAQAESAEILVASLSNQITANAAQRTTEDGSVTYQNQPKTRLLAKLSEARGIDTTSAEPPRVSAGSYIVADIDSEQIYAEKNAEQIRPIASISKLMTSLVATDTLSQDRQITVSDQAANSYGNLAGFSAGEKMSISDMMYPLLLYSANDAAISIGDYFSNGHFKNLMNKQARALGMMRTNFVEPSGLSAENVSTASDLFKLAKHIYEKKNSIFDITRIESQSVQTSLDQYRFQNIHQLRHIEGYVGGKNGYISASGGTLLTLFKIKDDKGEIKTVAIIVLGSDNSAGDSLALLSWLKKAL